MGEHPRLERRLKAYTVAIPNFPLIPNKRVREFIKWICKLDGLLGIHPHYPDGNILLFRTENQAKVARNQIKNYPNYEGTVGHNIVEVEIDDIYGEMKHD